MAYYLHMKRSMLHAVAERESNEWNYALRDFTIFNDRLSSTVSRPNNAREKWGKKNNENVKYETI